MCIQTGVSSSASQLFVVFVRNVSAAPWVLEPFGEAEVNYVYSSYVFANANEKIFWFDVSVYKATLVHIFNSFEHLQCDHENSF